MSSIGSQDQNTVLNSTKTHLDPFRDIIDRFGLVLGRQAETRAWLTPVDLGSFVVDEERFLEGEPLVGFLQPDRLVQTLTLAASRMWPVLGVVFPSLAGSLTVLGDRIRDDAAWATSCLHAVALGDAAALESAAIQAGVSPDFLLMALRTAYAPAIAAHKSALTALAPVDLWRRSYCPVCGSDPDLAMLENHPDPSEFLVSKSGEVWHHCPTCTHRWRFVRLVCPGCGNQNHETLNRFAVPGAPHEYIYTCEECRQYLPCLDLVEKSDRIDFDLAALHAVHLDAVAQSRGYTPLSPAPWTALGLGQEQAQAS